MSMDIVFDMLSGVTPAIFERFQQAGPGNWFQLFADGRVSIGPLPGRLRGLAGAGRFRIASTSSDEIKKECPIVAIECNRVYTYEGFREEIERELNGFY